MHQRKRRILCSFPQTKRKSISGHSCNVPQTGRWQVERSFAWLNFFRRLDKDHERLPESSVAFIQVAFINILLK
ncbi:transposase [Chitinophaga sancti]|uniref:Transposase n=1 Tax=Chitinophaga sancti TaxID=1004 RepID=A0ABZ0XMC1_9BACT|nr:transposase [Chitinophaga sancti]WQG91838.1 transposase [Chitinophaga sancti]